jgi:hypothetical protein
LLWTIWLYVSPSPMHLHMHSGFVPLQKLSGYKERTSKWRRLFQFLFFGFVVWLVATALRFVYQSLILIPIPTFHSHSHSHFFYSYLFTFCGCVQSAHTNS